MTDPRAGKKLRRARRKEKHRWARPQREAVRVARLVEDRSSRYKITGRMLMYAEAGAETANLVDEVAMARRLYEERQRS